MHRISEPQIVDAFTLSKVSPWPGRGTGKVRSSTLQLPGKNAARMLCSVSFIDYEFNETRSIQQSWWGNLAIYVPKIFPRLPILPQKHLAFDQSTIPVNCLDFTHIFVSQRIGHDRLEIAEAMSAVG